MDSQKLHLVPFTVDASKRCKDCRQVKPRSEFYKHPTNADRKSPQCKACDKIRLTEWRKNNPQRNLYSHRKSELKQKYGLTHAQVAILKEAQNGVCAICRRVARMPWGLCVDHDHATGRVRGLLCRPCNSALGLLQDSPEVIREALQYLDRHKKAGT